MDLFLIVGDDFMAPGAWEVFVYIVVIVLLLAFVGAAIWWVKNWNGRL